MGEAAANNNPDRIVRITCGVCSIPFGLVGHFYDQRHADGKSFYCPNGHFVSWSDNDLARAKREAENLRKRLEWAEEDARQAKHREEYQIRCARSAKGHATRLRKRIAAGQCPCCSETFANVAEHIAKKHPKYVPGDDGT